MKYYVAEIAAFYESPEAALALLKGRICAVECPESKTQVGTASDFKLARKRKFSEDSLADSAMETVLACTVGIDERELDKIAENLQNGTQLYVGQHLLIGPLT